MSGISGAGPWIVVAAGLLLMLLAAFARGDEAVARRTERFNATLSPRSTIRIENVSGDVVATAGREFSAVCSTTVTAPTQARADEVLAKTRTSQTRDGDELALESRWPEMDDEGRPARSSPGHTWTFRSRRSSRCSDCRINMRYEVVVPPGVVAVLRTVNGEVRVQGVDAQLDVQSVNGNVVVGGSKRGVRAQTVNGRIEVVADAALPGTSLELKTVSGAVQLTLPKDARFDLSATTMTGTIESTFPLLKGASAGASAEPRDSAQAAPQAEPPRARTPRRVVVRRENGDAILDVEELRRELEDSMRGAEAEVRESMRWAERDVRRAKFFIPGGEYHGSVGEGGATVRLSNLNGRIAILAAGTRDSDAKPLLERRTWTVTLPPSSVRIPRPEVRVTSPHSDLRRHAGHETHDAEDVVRGDVSGDFLATAGGGTYRIGKVTGKVTILTHSGEIHVASAGAGADLKSYGGDIKIGTVAGDFRAQTLAGDIRAGAVVGSAVAETSGGDIRIARVGGSADARTAGGDIVLPEVAGGVHAETGGGEVRVSIVAREPRGGVMIRNAGGDVTLTIPANFHGELDLTALETDLDENAIRSDFPEISVTRRSGSQQGSGAVNGGGPRVTVRTTSGSIRIRKGPPASP